MQWWANLQNNSEEITSKCNDPFKSDFPFNEESPIIKIYEYYLKISAGSFRSEYNKD